MDLGYVVVFDVSVENKVRELLRGCLRSGLLTRKDILETRYVLPTPPKPSSLPVPSFHFSTGVCTPRDLNYVV